MDINADDAAGKQFSETRRGADPAEVAAFQDAVVRTLRSRDTELAHLRDELRATLARVTELEDAEEAVSRTFAAATKTKREMVEEAGREAEATREAARREAAEVQAVAAAAAEQARSEAAVDAERARTEATEFAEHTRTSARNEAEALVTAARRRAEDAAAQTSAEAERLERELAGLRATAGDLEARLRAVAAGVYDEARAIEGDLDGTAASLDAIEPFRQPTLPEPRPPADTGALTPEPVLADPEIAAVGPDPTPAARSDATEVVAGTDASDEPRFEVESWAPAVESAAIPVADIVTAAESAPAEPLEPATAFEPVYPDADAAPTSAAEAVVDVPAGEEPAAEVVAVPGPEPEPQPETPEASPLTTPITALGEPVATDDAADTGEAISFDSYLTESGSGADTGIEESQAADLTEPLATTLGSEPEVVVPPVIEEPLPAPVAEVETVAEVDLDTLMPTEPAVAPEPAPEVIASPAMIPIDAPDAAAPEEDPGDTAPEAPETEDKAGQLDRGPLGGGEGTFYERRLAGLRRRIEEQGSSDDK